MTGQRDIMRSLVKKLGFDEARVVAEYAAMEQRGEVTRKSNAYQTAPEKYARALWNDGIRKGWLTAPDENS